MNVILLEKVTNLGNLGDIVSVKPGYARNFLIPNGKAKSATKENLAEFEARKAELEAQAAATLAQANETLEKINGIVITIKATAGDEGKLFGSIGTQDIADALTDMGFETVRKQIRLPDGAFRQLGTFEVEVQLHTDVIANINLVIEAEDAEAA